LGSQFGFGTTIASLTTSATAVANRQFLCVKNAILVCVQLHQCGDCTIDLLRGQIAIAVDVQQSEQPTTTASTAASTTLLSLAAASSLTTTLLLTLVPVSSRTTILLLTLPLFVFPFVALLSERRVCNCQQRDRCCKSDKSFHVQFPWEAVGLHALLTPTCFVT